jgi:hypothetical protein
MLLLFLLCHKVKISMIQSVFFMYHHHHHPIQMYSQTLRNNYQSTKNPCLCFIEQQKQYFHLFQNNSPLHFKEINKIGWKVSLPFDKLNDV